MFSGEMAKHIAIQGPGKKWDYTPFYVVQDLSTLTQVTVCSDAMFNDVSCCPMAELDRTVRRVSLCRVGRKKHPTKTMPENTLRTSCRML